MDDGLFDEIADAILDGRTIDWDAVQRRVSPDEVALLAALRDITSAAGAVRGAGTAAPPHEDGIGETWGHFTILERIGQGAFASVYRARDTHLEREVALKLLTESSGAASDRLL